MAPGKQGPWATLGVTVSALIWCHAGQQPALVLGLGCPSSPHPAARKLSSPLCVPGAFQAAVLVLGLRVGESHQLEALTIVLFIGKKPSEIS